MAWHSMACIHMAKLCSPKEGGLIFTDFGDKVGLCCMVARYCLGECFLVRPKHTGGMLTTGQCLNLISF